MKKPTLRSVAAEAEVSVATVSQVLRGVGRISEDTREKVMNAAKRLNYVPDGRAASMRSGEVREVGLLVHNVANPFNAEVVSGVTDFLDSQGYLASVLDSRDDATRQRRQIELLVRSARAGLMWVPARDTPADTVALLHTHGVPNVTFLRHAAGHAADHVGIHNRAATRLATTHLADLGHRCIAYLGGNLDVESRLDRISGYREIMAERNLAQPVIWPCDDSRKAGMQAFQQLHVAHPEVTAVVCNGDMIALGATLALARAGLRPGLDVSVVGFDGIEEAALAAEPLTTISIRPYQLGQTLAETLIRRIRTPAAPYAELLVHGELITGATTNTLHQSAAS
ncbi:LacI family DNA-binding transcriptional regulator [Paracoccus seriniphilus]|uniref:Transcriptional regulator, LacI family n=1 Tax=Paracoccus seriniphilus TaxID=184748 RepID=A0A239PZQ3_9RHOB|nr:LacI family DNA-binding transcriptional regulator [Paracoccus seriniphilus]WCR15999.1 LacI family DNA-binding transcriptional regulator [Paracoccus seriniphilus]SNT75493.1 transcriptional regulator, LacI family [Paracoccus seriniphilus]